MKNTTFHLCFNISLPENEAESRKMGENITEIWQSRLLERIYMDYALMKQNKFSPNFPFRIEELQEFVL